MNLLRQSINDDSNFNNMSKNRLHNRIGNNIQISSSYASNGTFPYNGTGTEQYIKQQNENPNNYNNNNNMKSSSIPISISTMRRTPSELQLNNDEQVADFRDYVMFSRIVERLSKQRNETKDYRLRLINDNCLAHIIETRNNYSDGGDGNGTISMDNDSNIVGQVNIREPLNFIEPGPIHTISYSNDYYIPPFVNYNTVSPGPMESNNQLSNHEEIDDDVIFDMDL